MSASGRKPQQARIVGAKLPGKAGVAEAQHQQWFQVRGIGASALWLVLGVALVQGLLFLALVPPWQHYDEPTHFEHALLIATTNRFPEVGDEDQSMRREILNSVIASDFFRNQPEPPLLEDYSLVWLGVTELGHPPLYYALVSLPLRLVSFLDPTSQLYVARSVSLLLFIATVGVAWGLMRDLVEPGHPLGWAVPLGLALVPSFADVMTSLNSDVGAAFLGALFLWGAVRLVRFGMNWRRVVWILGVAALGLWTKNTAVILVPLALLALLLSIRLTWLRWYQVVAGVIVAAIFSVAVMATGGDAAGWYRWSIGEAQPNGTQATAAQVPLGSHVIASTVGSEASLRQLINPLTLDAIASIKGKQVTVGGWLWADQPGQQAVLGARMTQQSKRGLVEDSQAFELSTTPTFVSWSFIAPGDLQTFSYVLYAELPAGSPELTLYLDGAVVAVGDFPLTSPPQFASAAGTNGMWHGEAFTNVLRNGSGEQSWLRLRPWVEHAAYAYIHRSPAQVFASLIDAGRVSSSVVLLILPQAFDSFAGWFGWANVRLANPIWVVFSRLLGVVLAASALVWLVRHRNVERRLYRALLLLTAAGGLAWLNVLLRPLPLLGEGDAVPIARYTFPAMIATMLLLFGGAWTLVPRRYRMYSLVLLLGGLATLNIAALLAIRAAA